MFVWWKNVLNDGEIVGLFVRAVEDDKRRAR